MPRPIANLFLFHFELITDSLETTSVGWTSWSKVGLTTLLFCATRTQELSDFHIQKRVEMHYTKIYVTRLASRADVLFYFQCNSSNSTRNKPLCLHDPVDVGVTRPLSYRPMHWCLFTFYANVHHCLHLSKLDWIHESGWQYFMHYCQNKGRQKGSPEWSFTLHPAKSRLL